MAENFQSWPGDMLVGGHPCLDLLNTRGGPGKDRSPDRLVGYDIALDWGQAVGLLALHERSELLRGSTTQQQAALKRFKSFRDTLHAALSGLLDQQLPDPQTWKRLQDTLRQAYARAILWPEAARLTWKVPVKSAGPDTLRLRAALAADALLTSEEVSRIRSCERCSWLYIDRSRGKPRRWCSMAICGNRAKAERHYRRRKTAEMDAFLSAHPKTDTSWS